MSDTYLWTPPDGGVSVRLRLDVVERLLPEVMRGFGSLPKRGAEVGGILLGSIDAEAGAVEVRDFLPVPIEYERGPSYLLSVKDRRAFDETLARAFDNPARKPIGFFRSHTRDVPGLSKEDVQFCEERFANPRSVILLIKPYAVRVSSASFVLKQNGHFPQTDPSPEFPFRRRDLEPASLETGGRTEAARPKERLREEVVAESDPYPHALPTQVPIATVAPDFPVSRHNRFDWFLAPLWVIGLVLLGATLGLLSSQWIHLPGEPAGNPFLLNLSVSQAGGDLTLRWDRNTPMMSQAWRATLTIDDGASHRAVALDASQLRGGSLVYRPASNEVRFRLEVFSTANRSLTEILDWRQ